MTEYNHDNRREDTCEAQSDIWIDVGHVNRNAIRE